MPAMAEGMFLYLFGISVWHTAVHAVQAIFTTARNCGKGQQASGICDTTDAPNFFEVSTLCGKGKVNQ